jgi:photosystem II stability/assembly factor-like uncharacterized protein
MKTRNSRVLTLLAILVCASEVNSAFAEAWTQTSAPSNAWPCIAASSDGWKLAAGAGLGTIYLSTNSGVTWTTASDPQLDHASWTSIALSADGSRLLAVPGGGWIYTSTNSGVNWTRHTAGPTDSWHAAAVSADGNKLFAFGQKMYISTDSGVSWTTNNLPYQYGGSAMISADGNTIVFANPGYPAHVFTSTNAGTTWVTNSMPFYIMGIAASADGKKLAVPILGGGIYTSTNSGTTWSVTSAPNIAWRAIASSADGNILVAAANNGVTGWIYSSTNAGLTWTPNDVVSLTWNRVASSADGSKLFAAAADAASSTGPIFRLATAPVLRVDIQCSASTSTLSWVIPSQPYSVQQSLDLSHWTDVSDTPTVNFNTLQNELTVPTTGQNNFFRLKFQ